MQILIRPEAAIDAEQIEAVTIAAFLGAAHSDHTEHAVVRELRRAGALSISLVAERNETVVGHVALSPVAVSDGTTGWYGLGPVSVSPEYQGRGIGSRLVSDALNTLRDTGAKGCTVLGEPSFYGRFGFRNEPGIRYPGVPQDYFQVVLFSGGIPGGVVTYHEAFQARG